MSETSFSQVNTAISVQEASFLTPQQYDQLLQADDAASRSALLQGTVYAMDAEAIKDLNAIEQVLMKHLYSVYNWALEISPSKELVEIFTLRYTYHNLKVSRSAIPTTISKFFSRAGRQVSPWSIC